MTESRLKEKAKLCLERLINSGELHSTFGEYKTLDVHVFCAGEFPSFNPFVELLGNALPQLSQVNFTLVDPNKVRTDKFDPTDYKSAMKVTTKIRHETLGAFLKNPTLCDVAYFEQPAIESFHQMMCSIRFFFPKRFPFPTIANDLPYLGSALKNTSVIMGVFKNHQDHYQMTNLLRYSLDLYCTEIIQPEFGFLQRDFSSGLVTRVSMFSKQLKKEEQEKKSRCINLSSKMLIPITAFSIFTVGASYYSEKDGRERVLNANLGIATMMAQHILHRPDNYGLALKMIFLVMQFMFFYNLFNNDKSNNFGMRL